MKIVALLCLLCASAIGQSPTTGEAQTKGACSPANTGSNNTFIIKCGIGKEQGDAMLRILNKILANQMDPATVMDRLDEIVRGVRSIQEANKPRRLSDEQKTKLISGLTAMPKPRLILEVMNAAPEVFAFADDFIDVFVKLGWLNRQKDYRWEIGGASATGLILSVRSAEEYPKPAGDGLFTILGEMGLQPQVFFDPKLQPNEIKFYVSSRN